MAKPKRKLKQHLIVRERCKSAGTLAGINLRPHDLRRHAATDASRSGSPIEIVSKVILRHAHLSEAQRYLGKVTDVETIRWIENLAAQKWMGQCSFGIVPLIYPFLIC